MLRFYDAHQSPPTPTIITATGGNAPLINQQTSTLCFCCCSDKILAQLVVSYLQGLLWKPGLYYYYYFLSHLHNSTFPLINISIFIGTIHHLTPTHFIWWNYPSYSTLLYIYPRFYIITTEYYVDLRQRWPSATGLELFKLIPLTVIVKISTLHEILQSIIQRVDIC